jgi:hypothetical protein
MKRSLLALATLGGLLLSGCAVGSRDVVTQTRSLGAFERVTFEGLGELTIVQGEGHSLHIEAESNVIKRISTEVRGDTLHIGYSSGIFWFNIIPTRPIRYTLTVEDLSEVDLTGLGSVYAGELSTDRLTVGMSGAGKIVVRSLNVDRLTLNLTGLGSCELAGRVRRQDVLMSGGGDYDGADLESEIAGLHLSGLGKATVWATDDLDIRITGAGGVEYYGDPRVSQNVTSLGRVRSLGAR